MIKIRQTTLTTTEQVIEALGGTTAAAEWAGMGPSGISNWLARGIPPGWHYRIDRYLATKGYTVAPEVFGYSDERVA